MAGLKSAQPPVEAVVVPERVSPTGSSSADLREVPRRSAENGGARDGEPVNEVQGFSKSIRKMWANPAGKSMRSQGMKIAVAMMYEDYIETLDLTDEEAKHFRELLGGEMANQQEFGMKMMDATPEERTVLAKEMTERNKQDEEDIKTFLNSDEDFEAFKNYKGRLPERQQLEGVRAAMAAKDAAMDEETEARLVEVMYKARTQPGLPDYSGKAAYFEADGGDMVGRFEETWKSQQALLREEVDFLNATQQEAFFEHQEQLKEFQLMGLEMAGKMMKGEEE